MKNHYHTSVDHIIIGALTVAVVFHAGRLGGAWLATRQNAMAARIGVAIGGFFTFGGMS